MAKSTPNPDEKNGSTPPLFQLERSLTGVALGFMNIAERVMNGTVGNNEAKEATRALNGVSSLMKTQLETIRIFEKGSERAQAEAMKILSFEKPEQKAMPNQQTNEPK